MCFTDLKDLLSQELRQSMQLIHRNGIKFFGPRRCKIFVGAPLRTLEVFFSIRTGMACFGVAQGPGFPMEVSRMGYPRPFSEKAAVLTIIQNRKICEIFCYFPAPQ